MLDLYEFDLIYVGNKFFVQDRQRANLGDIESDVFNTISDVINRMEVYHNDYIYESIEECESMGEKVDVWDYRVKNLIENNLTLSLVDPKTFEKYLRIKNIDQNIFKKDFYVVKETKNGSSYYLFNDGEMAVIYTDNGSYAINVIGDIEANLIATKDIDDYKKGDMIDHFRGDGNQFREWLNQYSELFFDTDTFFNEENNKYKIEFESQNWYEVFFDNLQGEQEYSISLDADNLYDAIDEVKELIKETNKTCEI